MLQRGDRFQYQSVVDHYRYRPAYAPAVYETLYSLVDPRSIVLDIGCGPGKLSRPIAQRVARVDAVDLSPAMIAAAKTGSEDDGNINWIVGDVHTAALDSGYDLIMAGASIHWMDWDRLFPFLALRQSEGGHVAFTEGDGAMDQPWGHEELALMKQVQLEINEERPEWVDTARFPAPSKASLVDHPLFAKQQTTIDRYTVTQSVEDYINVFFSRAAFALDCMPVDVADRFRKDMGALLASYAIDGRIEYEVESIIEVGRLTG